MAALMQAMMVLMWVSMASGQSIISFSDDKSKCFNQCRLAPQQYYKANTLLQQRGRPIWASEYVMPFGIQCASGIAQGWAHLLMHLVRCTMDQMEDAARWTLVEQE